MTRVSVELIAEGTATPSVETGTSVDCDTDVLEGDGATTSEVVVLDQIPEAVADGWSGLVRIGAEE
jgi:hypothetical protein